MSAPARPLLTADGAVDRDALRRVIRVRLPLMPVVSEADFALVQQLMHEARERRPKKADRAGDYAYRMHAVCACGRTLYVDGVRYRDGWTHFYFCPRRLKRYKTEGIDCPTGYMKREKFEPVVDAAIAAHLSDPAVLTDLLAAYFESLTASWRAHAVDGGVVAGQKEELQRRRQRVLDAYFDGTLSREERDTRLAPIARDLAALERLAKAPVVPLERDGLLDVVQKLITAKASADT